MVTAAAAIVIAAAAVVVVVAIVVAVAAKTVVAIAAAVIVSDWSAVQSLLTLISFPQTNLFFQIGMHHRFSVAINNVIWRLVTGRRTSQRDPQMTYLTKVINDMFDGFDPSNPLALLQVI